jgi:diguanylate cyclase (GGDEF)-like protein
MRVNPAVRLSLGLVALAAAIIMFADLVLGFLPDDTAQLRRVRNRSAENLALLVASLATSGQDLGRFLRTAIAHDPDLLSIGLRLDDGTLLQQAGEHAQHWRAPTPGEQDPDNLQIPLTRQTTHWADLELSYRSSVQSISHEWTHRPSIQMSIVVLSLGFVAYYLYLRRVLQQLDPGSVVPERVRMAFNALTEGVLILDAHSRIVLTNDSFGKLRPGDDTRLTGRRPSEIDWLCSSLADVKTYPWTQAMNERSQVIGVGVEIPQLGGAPTRKAIMNCAPIFDGTSSVRGCLITYDDVTALDHANSELMNVLGELQQSRQKIELQNEELTRLATRDSMTGCFNRRAFFEKVEPLFAQARAAGQPLSCIMGDIDHFKQFNDKYGHTVGDKVIQAVAKYFLTGLREVDLLCRYGGEEFCIVLPGATLAQATEVAERMRVAVQDQAGASIRSTSGLRITSSFGVATITDGAADIAGLIDQADESLYVSKQNGRNRVSQWKRPATPQVIPLKAKP